jgi:hypothetical protein
MEKNTVLGKALYLEFRNLTNTYQLIITPEVMKEDGTVSRPHALKRQLDPFHSRRNWTAIPDHDRKNVVTSLPEMNIPDAAMYARERMQFIKGKLSTLHHQGWKLYKTPVAVEFSYEDLLTVDAGDSPAALIRRILKARTAAGFEDSLFNAPVA